MRPSVRSLYSICFPGMRCVLFTSLILGVALGLAGGASAVDVPPRGECPPYPVSPGEDAASGGDVVPRLFSPGERIEHDELERLRYYLPREVWQRRRTFFYEGMQIQVGPCHRRYPAPEFFRKATEQNRSRTRIDEQGNLLGYSGEGLPFSPKMIDEAAPDAGWKWAWNYRYRYQGSGFRGKFRIIHMLRRGRKTERFEGDFFMLPTHGYPNANDNTGDARFWAGGKFYKPPMSRGIAWRQRRSKDTEGDYQRSDDVWVWVPDERRVRRAPPFAVGGIFMPTYTRGQQSGMDRVILPDTNSSTPGSSVGITEHQRRGFVGLLIRPNAYRFHFMRTQDVLAPINSDLFGYPLDPDRSYGPSGLSVANGRWELRRAIVLRGERKKPDKNFRSITLYIDALTQAPLYLITRKQDEQVKEVGIFMGKFTGDDPLAPKWDGNGKDFGWILPVAETLFVAGEEGWIRESFDLQSAPPDSKERKDFTSTTRLQRGH